MKQSYLYHLIAATVILLTCNKAELSAQSNLAAGIADLDFSPFQTVYKGEVELCENVNHQAVSIHCIQKNMNQDWMNGNPQPYKITKNGTKVTYDNSTVRVSSAASSSYKQQQALKKQQRDNRRRSFFEQKRAERIAAARRASKMEIARKRMERAVDNQVAASTEAAVNASLQGTTDQRIANDQWHATEGRAQAQAVARQAVGQPRGLIITNNSNSDQMQTSGHQLALNLKSNQNRNRKRVLQQGGMGYYTRRPAPQVVRQKPNSSGQYVFTGRATKSQIFIKKDSRFVSEGNLNGPKYTNGGTQFRLDPHATVTTGQDWHSETFKNLYNTRIPPRPLTAKAGKKYDISNYFDELLD